jgi:hypothetical protein
MAKPTELLRKLFIDDHQHRLRALWRLAVHTIAMLVIVLVIVIVLSQLGHALGLGRVDEDGNLMLPQWLFGLGNALGIGLATWGCGRWIDRRPFAGFGLHLNARWWLDLGFGLVLGGVLMGGIFVLELQLGWLEIRARHVPPSEGGSFGAGLAAAALMFVAVGFYEELMSRGYHLRNLAEGLSWPGRIGPMAALTLGTLISSGVFGLLHANNPNATALSSVLIMQAGCMLALGLIVTGELALPIGLHISWNFCQGNVFGFPVSGTDAGARVLAIEQLGDPLWTGGEFGPEAGLLGAIAMLVGAVAIMAWGRLTRHEDPST